MAIKGPMPKDDAVRRNEPTFSKLVVEWDGVVRGPELPKIRIGETRINKDGTFTQEYMTWNERTVEWYEMWRRSPQAMVWVESDWEHMLETALIHHKLWDGFAENLKPTEISNLSNELRRRMAPLGSTFEDRRKLRLDVKTPNDERNEEVAIEQAASSAVNYMERLNKAAAKDR